MVVYVKPKNIKCLNVEILLLSQTTPAVYDILNSKNQNTYQIIYTAHKYSFIPKASKLLLWCYLLSTFPTK